MRSGEDRLVAALDKQLPPPWAVHRNVAWLEKRPGEEPQDGEADAVLAHPDLGVMVIEVKGGRIQRIGGQWESVDRNGQANKDQGPVRAGDASDASAQARLRCPASVAEPRRALHPRRRISGRRL